MKEITYSLRSNASDSEEYYGIIRNFALQVITEGEKHLGVRLDEYIAFLAKYNLEEIREREEYILELLSFGVLWETYGRYALNIKFAPFITMAKMGEWRKKHRIAKPYIDFARGILITLFLFPEGKKSSITRSPTLAEIDKVCRWFEATGEFREQAVRFIRWRAFWGLASKEEREMIFKEIADFTQWFKGSALTALEKFTLNVDGFRERRKSYYRWREDRISCMRTRDEYHLNMTGAEILNMAYKKGYAETKGKVLLLPGCMRKRNPDKCLAKREPGGLKCIGCCLECRVNSFRLKGKKENFEVYIIPHASDLSQWAPDKCGAGRGVVASACVTTLVEGGWELKRYGIDAQCVLLEFSGCKKHWHTEGLETEISIKELDRILN